MFRSEGRSVKNQDFALLLLENLADVFFPDDGFKTPTMICYIYEGTYAIFLNQLLRYDQSVRL